MTELSKQEMLKEIVQRMIDGGWMEEEISKYDVCIVQPYLSHTNNNTKQTKHFELRLFNKLTEKDLKCYTCRSFKIRHTRKYCTGVCRNLNEYVSSFLIHGKLLEGHILLMVYQYSYNDLLADPEAMKSLVGNKCVRESGEDCPWESLREPDKEHCEYQDSRCRNMIKIYIYHAMQALKLMLTPGGDAIKYLWEVKG